MRGGIDATLADVLFEPVMKNADFLFCAASRRRS